VESASAKADPIEVRLYPGANADFSLYEDEGDNYDYEHGAHSIIPIHWDNKTETLTIGDRQGSFPGMLEHRTFHIVSVTSGHGTGIGTTSDADATIEYDGKAATVHVRPQS
jgi:alpha-D-xyloside xylohydrolase